MIYFLPAVAAPVVVEVDRTGRPRPGTEKSKVKVDSATGICKQ
jgi:hypothetical protein